MANDYMENDPFPLPHASAFSATMRVAPLDLNLERSNSYPSGTTDRRDGRRYLRV